MGYSTVEHTAGPRHAVYEHDPTCSSRTEIWVTAYIQLVLDMQHMKTEQDPTSRAEIWVTAGVEDPNPRIRF